MPASVRPVILRALRWTAALALGVYGPMIAIHALSLTGRVWSTTGVELFILVPFLGLLACVASVCLLPFRKTRPSALFAGIVSFGLVALFPFALRAANGVRSAGFLRAARRAEPLVAAIEAFERDTGRPPGSLEELVPRYLPGLPDRLPPLQIVTGAVARNQYGGNAWALTSFVPSGLINFDQFLYYPNQQYPRVGHGGWLEPIGRWAYVHE